MDLLVNYIQPLTHWLQENPHWSLLITFLISLTESLAIIGSIVPGSVTMTAIGILAGSGIMRIDLTLLAAILGAIAGDTLSYIIGYIYSERLVEIWPFKKYPKWIQYGKDFFGLHGGKSVLIGRFIGPLRSIIPVIAGILHMKHWRFLIANVLSAIGWALLYVMPGVIIGAASQELSAETATRLFVLILVILVSIWVISLIIKTLVGTLNSFLKRNLHALWLRLKNKSIFAPLCGIITPENEKDHYTTASLALIALSCGLFFISITVLTLHAHWLSPINLPTHLFLQSFHTKTINAFFIFCTQLTSLTTLGVLFITCCSWFIYYKDVKIIYYLASLIIFTYLFAQLLSHYIPMTRPPGLLVVMPGSSFVARNLVIATAFYGFILFYINRILSLVTNALRTCVFTLLGLSGLGALYLGDYWLSDVLAAYFGGAAISLIYCLIYRKNSPATIKANHSAFLMSSLLLIILFTSASVTYFNFSTLNYNHMPYHKEFALSEEVWWTQQKPILPVFRLNRIGKRISLLNIQYSGELDLIEENLRKNGWETYSDSFFNNLLTWTNTQKNSIKLPLLTQLYENKAPSLIMIYKDKQSRLTLELRMWESNYHLIETNKPLWIGSIHSSVKSINKQNYLSNLLDPLSFMLPPENPFIIKKIMLPDSKNKTTIYPTQPYIILIKKFNKTDDH